MTTSTIAWWRVDYDPPYCLPDSDLNVLLGLSDGDSCEGFLSADMHGGQCWYDVTAQPIDHARVLAWAEMPEYKP